jgi:hypothetical protein
MFELKSLKFERFELGSQKRKDNVVSLYSLILFYNAVVGIMMACYLV